MTYQKQTWNNYNDSLSIEQNKANNAFATAEGLNHIEEGIASKADKATTEQSLLSLNQQLAETSGLNAKKFGAVGDGVTDDTLAIEAMLIASQGKKTVIPAGEYIVSNLKTPPFFDITLDPNATLKLKNGSTASAMFNMGLIKKGRIVGGTIDGNKENINSRIHTFVGQVPSGSSLEIEHIHLTNFSDHGTYITNFGGYLGFNNNLITKQGEHRGIKDTSTCIVSVMEGEAGAKGLLRFNHNRAIFKTVPRVDGSNPGGVFFAPTLEYATGTGNFSTFEALGNYFYGYGQHLINNDISPLHTYPSTEGARFIGNYFEKCGFCAISAKSVQDFICTENYIIDGMVSTKNSASEGAISYAPGYHAGVVQRPRAVIANNIITNPGGEPNQKQTGIAVLAVPGSRADNIIVSGNILTECGTGITANYTESIKVLDNIINGAIGGAVGTEMGIRFDNMSGVVELRGNSVTTKNGHGVYCLAGSPNAVFILDGNVFDHSSSVHYACIFRGIDTAKFTGNVFKSTAGYTINIAQVGDVKVKHFIWDASNTIIEGPETINWHQIEKVSGDLFGTINPTTITPSGAGVKYTNKLTGQTWVASGNTVLDWQQVQIGNSSSAGTTPTIKVGEVAPGPGGSASISGSDSEGQITVNTGISPGPSGGGVATIAFQTPLPKEPVGVMLSPANGNALVKMNNVVVYNSTLTTKGFSISTVGTLNASLPYVWYYKVLY